MNIELKNIGGQITGFKQINRDGIPVGIVEGYIATWDTDRGNDRFVKGAFQEHLAELRAQNRQIRLKDHHGRTVGGFPIEGVFEDDRGLFGTGEINLEVQQGKEMYSLLKQKVLTDLSIGFTSKEVEFENGIRIILRSKVWEGSVVDEPMNPNANITNVKTATFGAFPEEMAPMDTRLDIEELKHIAEEEETGDIFTKYDVPIIGKQNDKLCIIPRGVFAARVMLSGHKAVIVPTEDEKALKTVINSYYKKMKLEAPFKDGAPQPFCKTELKNLTKSDFQYTIQNCKLSRDAAAYITSNAYPAIMEEQSGVKDLDVLNELAQDLKSIKENLS
jgi:HK97 family phage prohead protease